MDYKDKYEELLAHTASTLKDERRYLTDLENQLKAFREKFAEGDALLWVSKRQAFVKTISASKTEELIDILRESYALEFAAENTIKSRRLDLAAKLECLGVDPYA